jgi:Ran GTPase-activating protein (RanGAP) involved in mRNA processing and transport
VEEIDLSCNWFGTEGLFQVKDEFTKFTNLRVLRLGTNKLCFGEPNDLSLAVKLKEVLLSLNGSMLEELDLQENSINDKKFQVLIPALENLKSVKKMNLSKNQITSVSFSQFITKVTWLTSLNLAGCILKDEGLYVLL